jgi:hypothetical protein
MRRIDVRPRLLTARPSRKDGTQSGFWNGGGCDPVTLIDQTKVAAARAEIN